MGNRLRLVLLSFLLLFVELALIRWTGSNVVYLSYFSNFVLLGSFLGIGVGFLRARARVNLFPFAPIALALLVLFIRRFPVTIDRTGEELIYFGSEGETGLPLWVTLPVIFTAVAATMAMLAEGVARVFVLFEPLEAYRLDVLGSLLGIGGFSLLAFLQLPPLAWGIAAGVGFAALIGIRRVAIPGLLAAAVLLFLLAREAAPSLRDPTSLSWSPYYKVHVESDPPTHYVSVNGIPHQQIRPVSALRGEARIYVRPFEHAALRPRDVLIVGAGTGTDVAVALARGVRHVDAVEIDPRLYELGRELHPDRPYDDPRVDVHVTDGRAFLERTDRRYDLVLFALPDSLTLVAGQSSLRLESYLFTLDAIREAKRHLTPRGVFAMYNYYREHWLVDRLAATLAEAFGRPPCLDTIGREGRLAVLSASVAEDAIACRSVWSPPVTDVPAPARDDYPFVYLREREIPSFYLGTIALILTASLVLVRLAGGPLRGMRSYVDLFCMGAAFLLLETKNVVQFALLFGTTWFVNALVFAGILATVLAAIEVARRVRLPRTTLYALLFVALAVAFAVPQSALLSLPWSLRLVVAIALAFAPVFLANLVFAERFEHVAASNVAFGANLLGAMVGGLLEYTSLLVGYRALLVLTALLYGLAFLFERYGVARERPADAAAPA